MRSVIIKGTFISEKCIYEFLNILMTFLIIFKFIFVTIVNCSKKYIIIIIQTTLLIGIVHIVWSDSAEGVIEM